VSGTVLETPVRYEEQLLLELGAAAVQGRAALGERSGQRDVRAGRGTRDEPFVKGPLCADVDGFSLHAGVAVPGHDRERLEKLCRYAARPAIAESRLSLLPDGRVAYSLKRRWKDGSTYVVLAPQVLIELERRRWAARRPRSVAASRGTPAIARLARIRPIGRAPPAQSAQILSPFRLQLTERSRL